MSRDPGFVGYIASIESYMEAKAYVYNPQTRILRYGALALIEDFATNRRYLALIVDVKEHSLLPSVDSERLQELTKILSTYGSKYTNEVEVLRTLLSPSNSFVRWHSLRELRLRILGQITNSANLVLPEEPPRPTSLVREPESEQLEMILNKDIRKGLYVGELAYNPMVSVYLNPERLTTHMAILGQTGSGKTETVKRLVAEYAWRKELIGSEGGVVVIDVAGEYTGYPYRRGDVVPILDVAMRPRDYTDLRAEWLNSSKKTIVIPYDLSRMPFRRTSEERYAYEIAMMICKLSSTYDEVIRGLLYARNGVYVIDVVFDEENHTCDPQVRPVLRSEAAELISGEKVLVVGVPLPDALSLEEVEELSASKSEYFDIVVSEMSEMLNLMEANLINEVTILLDVLKIFRRKGNLKFERIFSSMFEAIMKEPTAESLSGALAFLGLSDVRINYQAWLRFLLYPIIKENPRKDIEYATVSEMERYILPETGKSWVDTVIESTRALEGALRSYDNRTIASVTRGLYKVVRYVSPVLDIAQYRLLVNRIINGFSIVHLAPPSRGDTDLVVARLLNEMFEISVRRFSKMRRTLVVVEEAHNLAPADTNKDSKRALLRMAREGRKWGLSLVLVSQRPGFIDPNILSQAATLIALRITNPEDLLGIRRSVESVSQEIVDRLPDLEPGQALVSGLAVPERRIPLLVKVRMLEPTEAQPST